MSNLQNGELSTIADEQSQLDLAGALMAVGAPNGCVIGTTSKAFHRSFTNIPSQGYPPVIPSYINSAYARIDKEERLSVGRISVFEYVNNKEAALAYSKIISWTPSQWWVPSPHALIEGIGEKCIVNISRTPNGAGDCIFALLLMGTIVVNTVFPVEGDFKKYLIKLDDVLSRYLKTPNSLTEKIRQLDEAAKRKVEEVARRIAEENSKREAEELVRREAEVAQFVETARLLTNQHIRTLLTKRLQGIRRDDYGNVFDEKWVIEIRYFLSNVVGRSYPLPVWFGEPEYLRAIQLIDNLVADYHEGQEEKIDSSSDSVEKMSPLDFEHYCAEILRKGGWSATVTQASGDQGIDLIAHRGNVKAVLQCKKYAQPVGNGAVQEIIAGKQFEQADIAAVVSNNSYTPSAKQLANAASVHLLHYTELEHFAEIVGIA